MRDGPVRGAIKRNLARLYLRGLERTRAQRLARGQEPWVLQGQCGGCASCCEEPSIAVGRFFFLVPPIAWVWLWWQRVVNGFVLIERLPRERAFVFRCTHFDAASRRCDSYETRPGMCHDYPRLLLDAADPELFESCGYRVVARNGPAMIRALEDKGLAGEQLVQIKRKLRLE